MPIVAERASSTSTCRALRGGASLLVIGALAVAAAPAGAQTGPVAPPPAPPSGATEPVQKIGPEAAASGGIQSDSGSPVATTEADADAGDIIVTGIRASLQSAQSIKQNSEVTVDSITAQDIGALPDRSVTEALQRVPGVSIDRFAAGVDPDHFSVEGSGVIVRGLTFVRSEFNGRDSFTANNGRGLSFQDVPSELLGGVDVFKSQSAELIEGGIGGTVNLRTRVPFDQKGSLIAGSIEGSYGDFAKQLSPTVSYIASDRFETEVGEFGFLTNFVYSQLISRGDGQQVSNFGLRKLVGPNALAIATDPRPGDLVYVPRGASFRSQEFDRERIGVAAAAQWRSPDRTALATLQFLRSDSRQAWTEHAMEIATDNVANNGDVVAVTGTELEFDDDGVFTNGVVTGPTGWRADQNGPQPRTPAYGLQSNNIRRDVEQRNITADYGANLKWTPTEALSFNFDYQHVESEVTNRDNGLWASGYQNASIELRGRKKPPIVSFLPPGLSGVPCTGTPGPNCETYLRAPNDSFSDPYNSFYRSAMDHFEDSSGNEDAFRIDGEYKFLDSDFLDSVRVGYRFADRRQTTRFSAYNWGVLSEQWGGGGPVWLDDPVDGVPTPGGTGLPGTAGTPAAALSAPFPFDNFFRGDVPVPTGAQPRLFYGQSTVDYEQYVAFARSIANEWGDRRDSVGCPLNWVPLRDRCDVIAGTNYRPQEVNPSSERTNSLYGMLRYDTDLGGITISGNIGLRYTRTKRQSDGFISFTRVGYTTDAECAAVPAGQAPPFFCTLTPAVRAQARAFANGALTENNVKNSYDYYLPSFNLRAQLTPQVQVRLAYSKGITPPDLGLTRNFYNIQVGTLADDVVNGVPRGRFGIGNPNLLPIQADNYDASIEWYFARVGQLTLSGFYKELTDVITNNNFVTSFTNNGATFDAVVSQPVNAESTGKIKGFEVAYQQTYDFLPGFLSGLGMAANYTYIDSSGVEQNTLSNTDPDVAAGRVANIDTSLLPLVNLSKHTVNLQGFYEKGPISLRAAYSWRSKFLITVRDVIVPFAPIMNESTGQLDASVFLNLNDNMKLGLQTVNLLNETTRTSQILNNDLLRRGRSWFVNDRRYTLILRTTFQ